MDINELIEKVRGLSKTDPSLAASMLRDRQEIKDAGLYDLVYLLDQGTWGCNKNDISGVLELLERHLEKTAQTALDDSQRVS
jgi:hypothetical protein